jgi:hypothetical protein
MNLSNRPSDRVEHEWESAQLRGHSHDDLRADSSRRSSSALLVRGGGSASVKGRLGDRAESMTLDVARCRLMSGSQLQRLYFPTSNHASFPAAARSCRRVLRRLVDEQILRALDRRIGGVRAGSQGLVYEVGQAGRRWLGDQHPGGRRQPTTWFVEHTLAVAEWYVSLKLSERSGYCSNLVVQVEAEARRSFIGGIGRQMIAPDLFVNLVAGSDELAWWVEVDKGTEHQMTLRTKIERFQAYYMTGLEGLRLGFFPRVLFIIEEDQRLNDIKRASKAARTALGLVAVVTKDQALTVLLGQTEPSTL